MDFLCANCKFTGSIVGKFPHPVQLLNPGTGYKQLINTKLSMKLATRVVFQLSIAALLLLLFLYSINNRAALFLFLSFVFYKAVFLQSCVIFNPRLINSKRI